MLFNIRRILNARWWRHVQLGAIAKVCVRLLHVMLWWLSYLIEVAQSRRKACVGGWVCGCGWCKWVMRSASAMCCAVSRHDAHAEHVVCANDAPSYPPLHSPMTGHRRIRFRGCLLARGRLSVEPILVLLLTAFDY